MKLSIGIVTFNRPECLAKLLQSFDRVDISVPHEVYILDNGSTVSAVDVIESFRSQYQRGPVRTCFSGRNVGFAGGWNVLENLMAGEYRLMMQDDTTFLTRNPKVDLGDVIDYMERVKAHVMSISDCSQEPSGAVRYGAYSDWPHLERSDVRQECGDFKAFPRCYSSLRDQGVYPEGDFSSQLVKNGIKVARYPMFLADHQRGGHSLIQTLLHEAGKVVDGDALDKLWAHPTEEAFHRLGLKVWE